MKKQVSYHILPGVFAAVLAVIAQLSIPLPSGVPLTLQTFAVALCGVVLGAKYGVATVLVYIVLGAVGLPVFAGFQGGFGVLLGVTGGYLWGFLLLALFSGIHTEKRWVYYALSGIGLLLCHLCGIMQFVLVSGMNFFEAFLISSAPFLIKDGILVVFAQALKKPLRLALRKSGVPI